MFPQSHRVRRRATGEIGFVLGVESNGAELRYSVAIGGDKWTLYPNDLEPAVDGFDSLNVGANEVYPYETWLKREAMTLRNAYRNDPAGALSNSRIEPQSHQISVLISCVEKTQPRMILADEVGLGKTIEAGLVLKELRARGGLRRVLILVPAGLVTQWKYELHSKFNEEFVAHDGGMLRYLQETHPDANPWSVEKNVIASMSLARGDVHRERVADADWDLVIVDEAHHARNWWDNGEPRPNEAFNLLEQLHDRVDGLLLLTATPMQLHDFEFFSMISLVEPGLFRDYDDFRQHRETVAEINAAVGLLRSSAPLADRKPLDALLKRLKAPPDIADSALSTAVQRSRVADWLSTQHRVSQAMVRNRKAYVGGFVTRKANRIAVTPTAAELDLEQSIREYIHWRHQQALARGDKTPAFSLTTFQKLACSSSRAVASALANRIGRLSGLPKGQQITDDIELATGLEQSDQADAGEHATELTYVQHLLDEARDVVDSKLLALEIALEKIFHDAPNEKVLIFTQFLATQEMIRARLGARFETVVFNGSMKLDEKDAAVRTFRDHARVMVSTEAGGEGRNFQFCHILFNYDLPWNPMRIEQRIGRVDRVGQTRNVLVNNFQMIGTLDERILDVLEYRVRVFTESVGALEDILGEIENDLDEICVRQVADANAALDKYEIDLEEKLDRARKQEAKLQDLVMDSKSLRRDAVDALLGRAALVTPQDLRAFVSAAMARYHSAEFKSLERGDVQVQVPPMLRQKAAELEETYVGSFDYKLALTDERLDFFAFGHPLVEAVMGETERADFAAAPGAIVASSELSDGVIADYELQLAGVRDEVITFSLLVTASSVTDAPRLHCPADRDLSVKVPPMSAEESANVEQRSRSVAQTRVHAEQAKFAERNVARYEAELARTKKRYAFERRRHEQRIQRAEQQVLLLERFGGGADSRRVIGGYRGTVTQAKRRLAELDSEEMATLKRLAERKTATSALRVVGVARVVAA